MSKKSKKDKSVKRPFDLHQFKITRASVFTAVITCILMIGITLFSYVTNETPDGWYALAAILIILTVLMNLLLHRLPKYMEIAIGVLTPLAVFMLVENYTHMLNQMWEDPVLLNIVLYYLLFGAAFFIVGQIRIAYMLVTFLLALAGFANYMVILLRSAPILPWDFYSLGVASSVADNYEYSLDVKACIVLLLFIMLLSLLLHVDLKCNYKKIRLACGTGSLILLIAFCKGVQTDLVHELFTIDQTLFTPKVMYRNNGLMLSFIINMRYLHIEKPSGYSSDAALAIQKEIEEADVKTNNEQTESVTETNPNIIVVMNEAFSDLSVLGDFETNIDYMPNIHALTENTQKGWAYVSVKGGNTANTEFEFLTGSSLYWLPIGSVAYQQYIRSDMPSLASNLSDLGYTSVAMHPYLGKGWNRDAIYDYFGFDQKYFRDSFIAPEILRQYVSDAATYEKIINLYETKAEDEKLFVFDVTMQNHSGYLKQFDNFTPDVKVLNGSGTYLTATEQYLSLIKRSDEAFGELTEYFSTQEEPTIILMFGDHQPSDYVVSAIDTSGEDTLEAQQKRYMVPYIMWANYDIDESETETLSVNYLGAKLLENAGLPLTEYQQYLTSLQETVPVITANMTIDGEGVFHARDDVSMADQLKSYCVLQYNNLVDTVHRLQNFFCYNEK